ncbi:MAG: hypothetical protein KDA51_15495 [Planctomycetales bacterium]|nr:hypothetical protein [Planctomycetales bacterium]
MRSHAASTSPQADTWTDRVETLLLELPPFPHWTQKKRSPYELRGVQLPTDGSCSNSNPTSYANNCLNNSCVLVKPQLAEDDASSGGGTRTPDTRIMIQRASAGNAGKNAHSENRAAAGAAVVSENAPIDAELQVIIERWAELPDAVKAGIVAMVRAAGG